MLYLIGGPGRAGKTTLARRLTAQHGIAYFSLDYLMMGLYHGAPETGVDPNRPEAAVAPLLWPVVRPLLTAMLENGEEYCVEGFAIRPAGVAELAQRFPTSIRCCFLGYPNAAAAVKLQQERTHPTTNPWPADRSEAEALAEFERNKLASIELRGECVAHGYPFVDTSADFEAAIEAARQLLVP
ncbi:hypothetical protein JW859_03695 [bacterium]|nr:hypothetical protein [bacterium]